jgi:SPOR domain
MGSRQFSKARWDDEPYVDDRDLVARPSKRASSALARFLIAFCGGVAATLAWQSYGGEARKMIASWSAPQAAPEAATRANRSPQLGRSALQAASETSGRSAPQPASEASGRSAPQPAPEASGRSAPQPAPEASSGWSAPQASPEAATRANWSPQLGRSAPQAAPEAATRAIEADGFVVQLSAQRSEPGAQAAFRTMQAKYSVLSGRQPLIRRKDQGERGIFYATQVGPFSTKSDADQLCETLRSAGGTCFVQKN